MTRHKLIVVAIVFFSLCVPGPRAVKLVSRGIVRLSQTNRLIGLVSSISPGPDSSLYCLDSKLAHVKIYDAEGKLLHIFGRRGPGPGEFLKPNQIRVRNRRLAIADSGKMRVFVYEIQPGFTFKPIWEIPLPSMADDIDLDDSGENLLISGYMASGDDISHELRLHRRNRQPAVVGLVSSHVKYGFSSFREYKTHYASDDNIACLGLAGYCAWTPGAAFYLWRGNIRVMKCALDKEAVVTFGEPPAGYVRPTASPKLRKARLNRDLNTFRDEYKKMWLASDLIAAGEMIIVTCYVPEQTGGTNAAQRLQFYRHDGAFIDEISYPEPGARWFLEWDRDRELLIGLSADPGPDGEDEVRVAAHRIVQ